MQTLSELVAELRRAVNIIKRDVSDEKLARVVVKYSPDQERQSNGEFGSGAGSSDASASSESPKTFASLDKAQEWARQHFVDGALQSYPKQHGVRQYRDMAYRTINNLLRGKKDSQLDEPAWKAEYRQMVKEIKGQMKPIPTGGVVVYRGFQPGKMSLNVGDTFTEKAFSSTTFNKDIASFFAYEKNGGGGKMFEIEVPAGVKAMYLGAKYDYDKNEHELLLEPGLKYEVTGKSGDVVKLKVVK